MNIIIYFINKVFILFYYFIYNINNNTNFNNNNINYTNILIIYLMFLIYYSFIYEYINMVSFEFVIYFILFTIYILLYYNLFYLIWVIMRYIRNILYNMIWRCYKSFSFTSGDSFIILSVNAIEPEEFQVGDFKSNVNFSFNSKDVISTKLFYNALWLVGVITSVNYDNNTISLKLYNIRHTFVLNVDNIDKYAVDIKFAIPYYKFNYSYTIKDLIIIKDPDFYTMDLDKLFIELVIKVKGYQISNKIYRDLISNNRLNIISRDDKVMLDFFMINIKGRRIKDNKANLL